ncbi:PI-PLC domain-containing protein [Brevundimonas guildfordensis]|uniref:GP-PDE domain-containing protein n=1 Tax=Brevundimonas guildfordensis TaxID=2762241 RepID=A0ABR8R2N3_9CAUL|nr:hypothetical protein [Brevundimonas guildfordensis]MBD7941722.1 hypothetical protein [Brevundimonas guildfordensis]
MLYTNSIEAIYKNYLDGFRHFEIDLVGLADGSIITAHDGSEKQFGIEDNRTFGEVNFDEVRLKSPAGYTIMTAERLLDIVKRLNIYMILDIKNRHKDVYTKIYNLAEARGLLHLVIPQAYNEATVASVRNLGFPNWLMTFWGIGGRPPEKKVEFCEIHKPSIVWMRSDWWSPDFEAKVRDTGVEQIGLHAGMNNVRSREMLRRGLHVMNDCSYISEYTSDVDVENLKRQVDTLYRLYLRRAGDPAGVENKVKRLIDGKATMNDISIEITNSVEYGDLKSGAKPPREIQ